MSFFRKPMEWLRSVHEKWVSKQLRQYDRSFLPYAQNTSTWNPSQNRNSETVHDVLPFLDKEAVTRSLEFLASILRDKAIDKVNVPGSLYLFKTRVRRLPGGLRVVGTLDLRQCQRFHGFAGDGVDVEGNLLIGGKTQEIKWWTQQKVGLRKYGRRLVDFLRRESNEGCCPLAELPQSMNVAQNLELRSCPNLGALPDDLQVGGSLFLKGCGIKALPSSFTRIRGDLSIACCPLETLPESLEVDGDLTLCSLPIQKLPASLKVGGTIRLESCRSLHRINSLSSGKDLKLHDCNVESLGQSVVVRRNLAIVRSRAPTLEVAAEVGRSITVKTCIDLKAIQSLPRVEGDLNILHCQRLEQLPSSVHVVGRANFDGCKSLARLPGQQQPGKLTVQGQVIPPANSSNRRTWPTHQWQPHLSLIGCEQIKALPETLKVDGPIDIAGTNITQLSKGHLKRLSFRWRSVNIEAKYLFQPETITPSVIFEQRNVEIRRVLLEKIGVERLVREGGGIVVEEDVDPGGKRRLIRFNLSGSRLLAAAPRRSFLNCFCPSTGREYLLEVPNIVETCHAAAAWLAGFDDPDDYAPIQET